MAKLLWVSPSNSTGRQTWGFYSFFGAIRKSKSRLSQEDSAVIKSIPRQKLKDDLHGLCGSKLKEASLVILVVPTWRAASVSIHSVSTKATSVHTANDTRTADISSKAFRWLQC